MISLTDLIPGIVDCGAGRGFLVEDRHGEALILTAAHCLPYLPPQHPGAGGEERMFIDLLGPVGQDRRVAAECLFVDPISDVAVLGAPDGQIFPDDDDRFQALVAGRPRFTVARIAEPQAPAYALTLDLRWNQLMLESVSSRRWTVAREHQIVPGMSGSPLVSAEGAAYALVSSTVEGLGAVAVQPALSWCLPGWLMDMLSERGM